MQNYQLPICIEKMNLYLYKHTNVYFGALSCQITHIWRQFSALIITKERLSSRPVLERVRVLILVIFLDFYLQLTFVSGKYMDLLKKLTNRIYVK